MSAFPVYAEYFSRHRHLGGCDWVPHCRAKLHGADPRSPEPQLAEERLQLLQMNSLSSISASRSSRIPLFARVDAAGTTMYTWNISDGGVYLKAPGLEAGQVPIGRSMRLSFELPDGGPAMEVPARVVWVDGPVRDHQGRTGVGLGMRFDEVPDDYAHRIRLFVDSFRYRVALFAFPDPALAWGAFGDLFHVEEVEDVECLLRETIGGHAGLVIIGESRGRDEAMDALRYVVGSKAVERQPMILYAAGGVDEGAASWPGDELASLLSAHGRLGYAPMPMERLELRSHAQRSIETFVLAFENELLTTELGRAFQRLRRENEYLRSRYRLSERLLEIVGVSEAMRRVHALIERIAPFDTSVVVVGETGTGKELVARALHRLSSRVDGPFVAQNCAALAETLLDSELFGHARGAFTGATTDRAGIFEAAEGGTVFLDEIGEMSQAMQAKLLRVLQEGEVKRVGDVHTRRVDTRIICATNRNLEALVEEGSFREDLYYRLQSFVLTLPPLRERREDIPVLALHFLERLTGRHDHKVEGFTQDALKLLQLHDWPGNARELEHTVERLLVLCNEGGWIGADLVREALGQGRCLESRRTPLASERKERSLARALEAYEREIIVTELHRAGGVIARAARELGMDRTTLSRRLRRLGVKEGA